MGISGHAPLQNFKIYFGLHQKRPRNIKVMLMLEGNKLSCIRHAHLYQFLIKQCISSVAKCRHCSHIECREMYWNGKKNFRLHADDFRNY